MESTFLVQNTQGKANIGLRDLRVLTPNILLGYCTHEFFENSTEYVNIKAKHMRMLPRLSQN